MTTQLEIDFSKMSARQGDIVCHPRDVEAVQAVLDETPRERALRLTNGTGRMPLEQALDLAMPGWRRTGIKFVNYDPPPTERPPRRKAKR